MEKSEIVRKIEDFAPLETQEKWDCSGWLVETNNQDVKKIMLCLTVTDDVVHQAKAYGCDMIVSHHPLFKINCHSELVSESPTKQIGLGFQILHDLRKFYLYYIIKIYLKSEVIL